MSSVSCLDTETYRGVGRTFGASTVQVSSTYSSYLPYNKGLRCPAAVMAIRKTTAVGITIVLLLTSGVGLALAPIDSSNADNAGVAAERAAVSAPGNNASIQVTSSGEVSAAPNKALLRLAVVSTADSADAARSQVAEEVASMRAALEELGVTDDQVRTAYFHIIAIHEETRNGTEIVGYRAAHGFEIDVDVESSDLGNRTGAIIDTAVQNGANQIDDVQFTLTEETRRQLRERALERAMTNARQDADFLATTSDLAITGVHSISTADVGVQSIELSLRETAADTGATVIEPGPVTVSATVSVTYEANEP